MRKIPSLLLLLTFLNATYSCKHGNPQHSKTIANAEKATKQSKETNQAYTIDKSDDFNDENSTPDAEINNDDFFKGKDVEMNKLKIDTTKIILDENSLLEGKLEETTDKVKTIIVDGKKMPFKDYINSCGNGIYPLPSHQGRDVFIIRFEYGDTECWEMCISDKGVINSKTQKLCVHYVWDDWGAESEETADYSRISFQILPNHIVCLKGEKREKGKIKHRVRYYRINSEGRFEELK